VGLPLEKTPAQLHTVASKVTVSRTFATRRACILSDIGRPKESP